MAEAKGTIKITADTSEAVEKVRTFEETLKQTFKRVSGEARPTAALEQFGKQLVSGDVLGGLEAITGRIAAFGVAGGAALGIAFAGLQKMSEQAEKLRQGLEDAANALMSLPAAGASAELMAKSFESLLRSAQQLGSVNWLGKAAAAVGSIGATRPEDTSEFITKRRWELSHEAAVQLDREAEAAGTAAEKTMLQAFGVKTLTAARIQDIELAQKQADIQAKMDERRATVNNALAAQTMEPGQGAQALAAINADEVRQKAIARNLSAVMPEAALEGAIQTRIRAMTGVTSEEMTAAGQLAPNQNFGIRHRQAFPAMLQGDAYMLGIANRSLAEGERLRKLGFRDDPGGYIRRGLDIKDHLDTLKDNEKLPEFLFKQALDTSKVLGSIDTGVGALNDKLKNLNFTNQ